MPIEYKKYHLQKYTRPSDKKTCPSCGRKQCFKLYVDDDNYSLDPTCGRCEHENSCGYHLPPKEYFKQNPTVSRQSSMAEGQSRPKEAEPKKLLILPREIVVKSHDHNNTLMKFFETWCDFPQIDLQLAFEKYLIGSTKSGHCIFWQIDEDFNVRTGKMMYYKNDGHRLHSEEYREYWVPAGTIIKYGPTNWVHSIMFKNKQIDETKYEMRQCLFGMHLLNLPGNEDKPVCIVESEKSAFLCSIAKPQYLWMASGGLYNLNRQVLMPLIKQNRRIILHPDLDGYSRTNKDGKPKKNWIDTAKEINYKNLEVSDFVKRAAVQGMDSPKCDIADILLRRLLVGQDLIDVEKELDLRAPHPALRLLKAKFDLKLISNGNNGNNR